MAKAFWPDRPVILESEHYGPSVKRGAWQDGSRYLDAVEDYHASYASIHWWPREFLQENRALIDRINRRLGYRIQLVEASWPKSAARRVSVQVHCGWRNGGVAPCLPGGHPAITLKDRDGGIAGVFVDESFDVKTLAVGPPEQAPVCARRPASRFRPGSNPPCTTSMFRWAPATGRRSSLCPCPTETVSDGIDWARIEDRPRAARSQRS